MLNDVKGSNSVQSGNNYQPLAPQVEVYAMPGKFLPDKPAKKAGSSAKIFIIIASIVLALVVAGVAGAIFYLKANVNNSKNTDSLAGANNTNQNTKQAPNSNELTNTLENKNTNEQDTNSISNEVSPASTSTPDNNQNNSPLAENLDADNDGLTVDEEALFLTNIARDDSDRDGYKDGQEIVSLFNPLVPGQALENSGLVSRYKNDNFSYSVLTPKSWLPSAAKTDNSEVMFLSDSETGEFISITVSANASQQTLDTLKAAYFTGADQLENFSLGTKPAWRTKTKVLMVTEVYVFVLEYHQNQLPQAHFPAVFEMMLKSFQLSKVNPVDIQPGL